MKKLSIIIVSGLLLCVNINILAEEKNSIAEKSQDKNPTSKIQQTLEEYKQYLSKVSPEVQDEIIKYRKAVFLLNKEKIELYKKLPQAAQKYLEEEQKYRKKLPIKDNPICPDFNKVAISSVSEESK